METYEKVNQAWKLTCRTVLGGEIGDLKEYAGWLKEHIEPVRSEKSALSGKGICLGISDYSPRSKFIGLEEVDFRKKFEPLNLNQLKDIDSIVQAVEERIYYTGDVVLGNSQFVEKSSNVLDSFYVYDSSRISDSQYVAYSNFLRYDKYLFGVFETGESSYAIKNVMGWRHNRCFNTYFVTQSEDCCYSARLTGCADAMFSFGAVGKRNVIGNLVLPRDKYLALKAKLLAEMRETLMRDKKIFSLFDLIEHSGAGKLKFKCAAKPEKFDKAPIEEAFSRATAVVLGRPLRDIDSYSPFLQKHVYGVSSLPSPVSENKVVLPECLHTVFGQNPGLRNRLITEEEMLKVGETPVQENDLATISLDLDQLAQIFSDVAFFTTEIRESKNSNVGEAVIMAEAFDCYKGADFTYSKKCAYDFWPRNSEYLFGSSVTWSSAFCLKSFYSKNVSRCLEVDSCENSTDLYYSHNCENVHDSMFCFNVKNLRNAIGNAPLPPEEYAGLKQSLLEQLATELEGKKDLKWDIYNLGAGRRRT